MKVGLNRTEIRVRLGPRIELDGTRTKKGM